MKVILVAVLLCIAAVVLSSPVDEAKKYNASAYKRDAQSTKRIFGIYYNPRRKWYVF